jgi:hypothetical protein
MSKCQRIGILISTLWLVGFPSFLYIDANRSHGEVLEHCLNSATALPEPTDRESFRQICVRAFEASRETPGKLVKEIASDKILLAAILGPIGLLWIVGGMLSYALRWILRRVLKGQEAAVSHFTKSLRMCLTRNRIRRRWTVPMSR